MNDLVVVNEAEIAALAALAGADPNAERDANRVPRLKINSEIEDKDGNPLPHGTFWVQGAGDTAVYAKSVKLRVLTQHFQYLDYDADAKKMANVTVQNTSFNDEFVDQKGTVRCGKPAGPVFKNLTDDQKKKYASITCFRHLRGLVSYVGKDQNGNEITVENQPVILSLKGSNFLGFDTEVVKNLPRGKRLFDYEITLTLEKLKNGSVTYYVVHYAPDYANPLPFDAMTVETLKHFVGLVESDNKRIRSKYNAAVSGAAYDGHIYEEMGGDYLDDDLADAA